MTAILLKPGAMAEVLGISCSLPYQLMRQGVIRSVHVRHRARRVRPEDLEMYVPESRVGGLTASSAGIPEASGQIKDPFPGGRKGNSHTRSTANSGEDSTFQSRSNRATTRTIGMVEAALGGMCAPEEDEPMAATPIHPASTESSADCLYQGFSDEARLDLLSSKRSRLGHFCECLKHAGFTGGSITMKEIKAYLPTWKNRGKIDHALRDLSEFILAQSEQIARLGIDDYFQESDPLQKTKNMVAIVESIPGKGRGRRAKVHFVPPTSAFDRLYGEPEELHYHDFEESALSSIKSWEQSVSAIPFQGAQKQRGKVGKLAASLNISRQKLSRLHKEIGIIHEQWKEDVLLSPKDVAALPRDRREWNAAWRAGKLRSKWVHNKKGDWRPSYRGAITGNDASKGQVLRTGKFTPLEPITDQLYQNVRVGTLFTDAGKHVHPREEAGNELQD